VSDVLYPMADVSVVVGPLYVASEHALIISIGGDREVPYQVMSRLQEELVAAGATRVVFQTTASGASWLPPDDVPGLLDQGVPMVLPVNRLAGVEVSQRNILHLIIQPSGIVDVRRGADPRAQQFRPQDIEGLWRQAVAENPQLIAAVKTHREAPYRYMVAVLDALHSAKAERISLQLLEN